MIIIITLITNTLKNEYINNSVSFNQVFNRFDSIQGIKARINLSAINIVKNIGNNVTPKAPRKTFTIFLFIWFVFDCIPFVQCLFNVVCEFGLFYGSPELS